MPHKGSYGNDKKMPMKKGKKYNANYEDGSYFRPMDSYPKGKNSHEY